MRFESGNVLEMAADIVSAEIGSWREETVRPITVEEVKQIAKCLVLWVEMQKVQQADTRRDD